MKWVQRAGREMMAQGEFPPKSRAPGPSTGKSVDNLAFYDAFCFSDNHKHANMIK